jgi:hypothetical protein
MEVSGQLHVFATLVPEKEPPISIKWGAEWTLEPVLTLWSKEKSLASDGNQTSIFQPRRPSLYRLSYLGLLFDDQAMNYKYISFEYSLFAKSRISSTENGN